ncbi:tetratricopeptide repeat protein [Halodesulfovibrio marinisediminis]|uniref:Tfp pilus assembly protein PilF n=1 Tax=Halodesulfovibrio marinisediminis DSM 17456 TaxID=1121457 RepID=A0A1N6DVG0_9BACT|nr:tetratricopeptide repeat protein [Halodesulfovibrio marinisediminis]SIN74674.1 Tfp pilus assembly protein PilF [Halodesulfovibrio marinisediminis DSM 17456]
MYRFISVLTLIVLFSIPSVASAQSVEDRSWIQRQIIHLKVYPHKGKAYELLKEGDRKGAAAEFAKVLEIDPQDTQVRLDYTQTLYDLGEYTNAKTQALEVLKVLPDNANALMLAVNSMQKLGRNTNALDLLLDTIHKGVLPKKAQEDAFVSAIDLLIKQKEYMLLLDVVNKEGDILFPAKRDYILALAYKGAGRDAEAKTAYEKALSYTGRDSLTDKDRLVALSDLADMFMKDREFDKAQKVLLEAHALAPTMMSVTYRLAELSYETKQYDKALEWIELSLKNDQTSKQLLLKAFILEGLGKHDEALGLFDRLTRTAATKKEKAQLYTQKGFVALKVGNNDAAIEAFEQSLSILPTNEALLALATAQAKSDEWAKAVETYELLLSKLDEGPDKARVRMQLGIAYLKVDRNDEAMTELSSALESGYLTPKEQEDALQNLGFLYYGSKQYEAAKEAFLAALEKQPHNNKTLLALARAQIGAGDYEDAIATLKEMDAQQQDFAISMLLAFAYEKSGQHKQAIAIYKTILESEELYGDDTMAVLERMATIESLSGRKGLAGDMYLKAYEVADTKDPDLLLRAGESYYGAKQYDKALSILERYLKSASDVDNFEAFSMIGSIYTQQGKVKEAAAAFRRALTYPNLTRKQRTTLLVNLGYLYINMDEVDTGIEFMRQAIAVGGDSPRLRMDMGTALFSRKHYPEAIEQFRRAKELGAGYQADLSLGFCYDKVNKPGLALYYMKLAEQNAPESVLQKSADLYNQLGYLYASEKSYCEAIISYEQALCIKPNDSTAFKLGQVLRLAGQLEAAEAMLCSVDPEQLETVDDRILYYEILGRVYKETEQYDKAQEVFRMGIAEKPSAEAYYLLGQAQESSEDLEGAISSYQTAVEMNPADAYKISLGYAYYKHEDLEQAAVIFEDLLMKDPDYVNLAEDLAYINKQLCRNELSVEWFKRAIDNERLYPNETAKSLRRKIYDFKEEIRFITDSWDVTGFYNYSPDDANFYTDTQGIVVGVLDNTAGVEVGYAPPKIGFRDGRIFQIIARVSVNRQKYGVFDFEADGTQGAAGVRYKPFKDADIALGVERLFKIGEDAEDNTLLRAMGDWNDGWAMKATEKNWNYTFIYGEVDQYVQDDERTVFLVHGRQGWTWNFYDQLLLTPHVYGTFREVSPDRNNLSHFEFGPAVSFRWLEGEDQYISYKRDWEILLRYTYGKYTKDISDDYSGVSVSLRLNF